LSVPVRHDRSVEIAGPDLPAGTRVKVVGNDGTVLLIEAV
jgi:membrane protein implicated in regulation of membrane protease activity